jgi:hypothetical protein
LIEFRTAGYASRGSVAHLVQTGLMGRAVWRQRWPGPPRERCHDQQMPIRWRVRPMRANLCAGVLPEWVPVPRLFPRRSLGQIGEYVRKATVAQLSATYFNTGWRIAGRAQSEPGTSLREELHDEPAS